MDGCFPLFFCKFASMKFRTEIDIARSDLSWGYENRTVSIGSCFAERIGQRLQNSKFKIENNPLGTLFNPASVADALERIAGGKEVSESDLFLGGDLWSSYDFHGSFSALSAKEAVEKMNSAVRVTNAALQSADRVIITFGTARVYEKDGRVVANCHKQPSREFVRRELSCEEIVERFDALLKGALRDKQVLFTVSPVRHVADGLVENFRSKATLRVAIEELLRRNDSAYYFPSYEILTDDLRDYRYYAEDMIHPSEVAVEYIWQKFTQAHFTDKAMQTLSCVERICAAAAHRPVNPTSAAHRKFCEDQLSKISALPELDFSAEKEHFEHGVKVCGGRE